MTILILQTWLIELNISHIQCKHEQLLIQTLHVTEHSGNLTKNLPYSLSTKFYYDWWPILELDIYIPSNFHYCSLYSANNKSLLSSDLVASATDRAKAVLPSLPWLSVRNVHVCLLLVLHEPIVLNMYFSLYLLFTFECSH